MQLLTREPSATREHCTVLVRDRACQQCGVSIDPAPLVFSLVILSTWITHFFLYTCTTFPSRPCMVPEDEILAFYARHRELSCRQQGMVVP